MKYAILFALSFLLAQPAFSAEEHGGETQKTGMMHDMQGMGGAQTGEQAPISEGIVKKLDREKGRITIEHGPLENLDMPAMTMAFQVKDSAMLDRLKEGDSIRFRAEQVGGRLTLTEAEPAGDADAHGH